MRGNTPDVWLPRGYDAWRTVPEWERELERAEDAAIEAAHIDSEVAFLLELERKENDDSGDPTTPVQK